MSTKFKPLFVLLATGALVSLPSPAKAEDDAALNGMLAELGKLNEELKKAEQAIPPKVQANLSTGRILKADVETVVRNMDHQEATEGKAIDAQRPSVDAACTNVPPEGVGRCEAVRVPFNQKVAAFNAQLERDKAKLRDIKAKAEKLDQELRQLYATRDSAAKSINTLALRIRLHLVQRCVERMGSSNEGAAHAQSICFDQANARLAGLTGSPAPPSSITPNRTPEQAIKDYENSGTGRAQGRKLPPLPPPPPPPPPPRN